MDFKLPPCLAKIYKTPNLLRTHYTYLLRFVYQYNPEAFGVFQNHLIKELGSGSLQIPGTVFTEPFKCEDLAEFCSEECPLYTDIFSWLKANTEEVLMAMNEDRETVLIVKLKDGKEIVLNLASRDIGKIFTSQIVYLYKRYVDIDLRRKQDKAKWTELLSFWSSKAKQVHITNVNEEDEYIKNIALDYLHTVPVKPVDLWMGDANCAVSRDGVYALFLKESLRSYISVRTNKSISFKKLTTLLTPDVESVWAKIKGVRYAFYKFKMTEEQKREYLSLLEELKNEENKETKTDESATDFEDEDYQEEWDLSQVFGGDLD